MFVAFNVGYEDRNKNRVQIGQIQVRKPRTSSFQAIKTDILKKIKEGYWAPGDTIPGEESIATDYGCSRVTVNRALRELADSGYVERRRKSGTRVSMNMQRAARIEIPLVRKEIEAKGNAYSYLLLEKSEEKATDWVQVKLNLQKAGPVIHVRCLHLSNGTPYQYEDRWINLDRVPAARDETFNHISPNEWLVKEEPFSEAEHTFSAALADKETASLLEISENDPLFIVERRTWQADITITAVKLTFPGTTYKMISRG